MFNLLDNLVEWLGGKLHHLVPFCPWVESAVYEGRGHEVCPVGHAGGEVVEAGRAIEYRHGATHQFLLWVGSAQFVKLLSPQVYLVAQVDFDGTYRLAGVA